MPRTKLESVLFWWLVCNTSIVALFVLLAAVLPSSMAGVSLVGTTSVILVAAVIVPAAGIWVYLTAKMKDPTPRILATWAIISFLGILRIEWSDGLLSLNPGLSYRHTIVDTPSVLIQVDLVALVLAILFFFAWRRKAAERRAAPVA